MELQTLCCALPSQPLHSNHRTLSPPFATHASFSNQRQTFRFGNGSKCLKWVIREPPVLGLNKFQTLLVHASDSNLNGGLEVHSNKSSTVLGSTFNGEEPFHGKSGSVSFCGLTHQSIEEGKSESAPFGEKGGSFLWALAPTAFIASLILPQFFVDNVVEAFLNDTIFIDTVSLFTHDALFYVGLATFLYVTDRVQRPYLQYSSKRWGLITGLRGYLFSAFLTMGLKIVAPVVLLFATWSAVGMAGVVAVTPFLFGCVVQIAFEKVLDNRGSACWPLVPAIFEVYRLHQLTKAANFAEKLLLSLKGLPPSAELARGPKKHLKRLAAPKAWMLDKLGGVFAPRPSTGPHKLRESLPLVIFLRNRLKYALTNSEVTKIVMQRLIKVDGKVRTDPNYPAGFMDVVTIDKTGEHFRLIYDVKGRFTIHRISAEEAKYKLCKVRKTQLGPKNVPFLVTHDGRTIRYPDPIIKANDTVQLDIATGKITDHIKFDSGNLCMITGGRNLGRVGTVVNRERHPGSFDIVHVKDSQDHVFATRLSNVFIIGKGVKGYVSLPKGKGIKLSIADERDKRLAAKAH